MYKASLGVYDSAIDAEVGRVSLELEDAVTSSLLELLTTRSALKVDLVNRAVNQAGELVELRLDWRSDCAAFAVSLAGMPAGFIPYDELEGSVGRLLPEHGRACSVCLSSEVDVWRRGVLDDQTGAVHVFTVHKGLAVLGASAFLHDRAGGVEGVFVQLDKGEPCNGPLRVPSHQLYRLQADAPRPGAPGVIDPEEAISNLANLTSQYSSFSAETKLR